LVGWACAWKALPDAAISARAVRVAIFFMLVLFL
jgi:hypothetical protein